MSRSELYGGMPDETPRTHDPDAHAAHTRHPRRGLRRGLGLLAGLIVLAMVGVLAYDFATNYFALNGVWYGPLRMHVGSANVSLEAYMDISTYLNGSLSGRGKICSTNPLGGGTTSVDLKVAGNRSADKVTISFTVSSATIGVPLLNIAMGPKLDLHGGYTTSPSNTRVFGIHVNGAATKVTLSGGTSAFPVELDMKRGVEAQFASACASLATYAGRRYRVEQTYCEPRPDPMIPILVGSAGKRAMEVAARLADVWMWSGPFEERFKPLCEQ